MIVGIFHQGSGLGNQLHRYVATRARATELGVDWGMEYVADGSGKVEGFKGKEFMNIDLGNVVPQRGQWSGFDENKVTNAQGVDIRGYDPEFNFIEDHTIIDGEFQDERYWAKHDIDQWLKVEPLEVPDDVCVIGFRGGEFAVFPDLFLPKEYWNEGISFMRNINPNMKFEVHTDDPATAQAYFSDFKVIHDVGINWRAMRYAKHAIIANSSFYILPRWIRNGITIAPRYWARHNTKTWALPQNYYDRFTYL